ncbi:hypothetical protein Hdeb2414_s0075g00775851 [Helianthus debilis subsp. tardiflorus]
MVAWLSKRPYKDVTRLKNCSRGKHNSKRSFGSRYMKSLFSHIKPFIRKA